MNQKNSILGPFYPLQNFAVNWIELPTYINTLKWTLLGRNKRISCLNSEEKRGRPETTYLFLHGLLGESAELLQGNQVE